LNLDPVLIRIIAVLLVLGPGVGVVAYILAWIIIPARPMGEVPLEREGRPASWHKYLPGLILIAIGAVLLIRDHWFWFGWSELWPVFIILFGLALILRRGRRHDDSDHSTRDAAGRDPYSEGGNS